MVLIVFVKMVFQEIQAQNNVVLKILSPFGTKNDEWDDDEANIWLNDNNPDISDLFTSDGKYKCDNKKNCNLYGEQLLNFEDGKYFNVYVKNGKIIQRCNWKKGDDVNPFIPCYYGSFIDTNVPDGDTTLGNK